MSFSAQIFKAIDLVAPALAYEGRPLGYDPATPETLTLWLTRLWYLIRSSVPLMEAAGLQLQSKHSHEPFTSRLAAYFEHHIEEERQHDTWLLEDLEEIGCESRRLHTTMAPPAVAALAGSQYYHIYHHHPVALLGYIALTEGYAPQASWIAKMQAESPLPSGVWRTLRLHSKEDVGHRARLVELLDDLPSKPEWHRQAVASNAIRSAYGWAKALDDVRRPATVGATDGEGATVIP